MAKNNHFVNSAKAFFQQMEQTTEAVYASIALAMWEFGYTQDEIADIFEMSQKIWDNHESNVDGMISRCEDETGIAIKPKK